MTGDGKSSRGTGRKSQSGKTCETSRTLRAQSHQDPAREDLIIARPLRRGRTVADSYGDEGNIVLISSVPESPARMLASLDGEPDSPENGQDSSSSSPESCESYSPDGSSSRMFQACLVPLKDWTSLSSSIRWTNAGMAYRGAFSIASSSEFPNVAAECSLSDILVAHAHPKYSLSPKAAAGILRRAEKRGKDLPASLTVALQALAGMTKQDLSLAPSTQQWDTTDTPDSTGKPTPTDSLLNPYALTAGAEATATEMRGMSSQPELIGMADRLPIPSIAQEQVSGCPTRTDFNTSVRRLTPTECERLQGMPDGWTHVHGAPMVGDTPLWETLLRCRSRNGSGDES